MFIGTEKARNKKKKWSAKFILKSFTRECHHCFKTPHFPTLALN